jgi:hypothetical protein
LLIQVFQFFHGFAIRNGSGSEQLKIMEEMEWVKT